MGLAQRESTEQKRLSFSFDNSCQLSIRSHFTLRMKQTQSRFERIYNKTFLICDCCRQLSATITHAGIPVYDLLLESAYASFTRCHTHTVLVTLPRLPPHTNACKPLFSIFVQPVPLGQLPLIAQPVPELDLDEPKFFFVIICFIYVCTITTATTTDQ